MIYRREEYVEEDRQDEKFPVKRIEVLAPLDNGRKRFVGQAALGVQTPVGVQQIPLNFEIDAENIEDAFEKFEETAMPELNKARDQLQEELQKARQQSASRIVRPGDVPLQGGGNVIDFGRLKDKQ
jgi:hypothetical protein